MGQPVAHSPALLLLAAFSRHDAALDWARVRAQEAWGPVALESPVFRFEETRYYERTMGPDLRKIFLLFSQPFDAADIVDVKLQTNQWEEQCAAESDHPEPRPLNLDPGYLTQGKLVLASTKDFVHRIYLDRGIYAEITLYYQHHQWRHHPWTFPDYRRDDYQAFFSECRDHLHRQVREAAHK